ncbi:transcription factor SOX-9-like [Vespula squamosa]
MLFANEWRKKLASENPRESNKDISVRLGILWKNISKDVKEKYFTLAREVDAEHKKKYPGTSFLLLLDSPIVNIE